MLSLQEILLRLTVAAVLGAAIGIARDLRRRPAGVNSIVEFESKVSYSQEETIVTQLNRQGVITEVIPLEGHHE